MCKCSNETVKAFAACHLTPPLHSFHKTQNCILSLQNDSNSLAAATEESMINELAIWQLNEFEISSVCPTLSLSPSRNLLSAASYFLNVRAMQAAIPQKNPQKKTRGVAGKLCGLESSFACISPALPLLFPFFFFAAAIGCIMPPSCCHGLTVSVVVVMLMLQLLLMPRGLLLCSFVATSWPNRSLLAMIRSWAE